MPGYFIYLFVPELLCLLLRISLLYFWFYLPCAYVFWLSHVLSLLFAAVGLICSSRAPHEDFCFAYANFAACFTGSVILTVINFAVISEQWAHFLKVCFTKSQFIWWLMEKKKSIFNNVNELLTHPYGSSATLGSLLAH